MFTIRTSGTKVSGIWWQIISLRTGRVVKESGPYHTPDLCNPRRVAFDDAVDYARRADLPLDTDTNPHTHD